jgi:uncharacterized repeat protein (TIGR03803 family)
MPATNLSPVFGFRTANLVRLVMLGVVVFALSVILVTPAHAQTFSVMYNFVLTTDPYNPPFQGLIVQGYDGNLHTTSEYGPYPGPGAVFTVSPSGTLTTNYDFSTASPSGSFPLSGLTLGSDGNYYGTTHSGGTYGAGTIFKITPTGTLTTLYNVCTIKYPLVEGVYPGSPPVQARDGNYYGTMPYSNDGINDGVVYKLTSAGKYSVLYQFKFATGTNGYNPLSPLILGSDGNFYGTTAAGGPTLSSPCYQSVASCGTVYKMSTSGKPTFLYDFVQSSGAGPVGPLVQATDGNFYGTTAYGGDANSDGVVFKITSSGKYTNLHTFDGTDGKTPTAGLVQASDGNLYGVTSAGGANGIGTLFKITTGGVFTKLVDFTSADGSTPQITLVQHTNGILYGEAELGGKNGVGTFYSYDATLPAFIRPVVSYGKVTNVVGILGQGFTGTTAVTFNGVSATFSVFSDTYLTATVPSLATAGIVTVTTPTVELSSLQKFIILPSVLSFSPTSGKIGSSVVINGGGLTGASKVTFGGVKATTFTVNSASKVTATVPTGAVTGKIAVTTSQGTATSTGTFTVTP